MATKSYHPSIIVDNPRRYTRQQARAGGRIGGETRRRQAHPWHKLARRLYRNGKGLNFSQIARALGRHASTVSRLLRGIIKTLLDAAEIAVGVNPYPAATNTPLRELFYTPRDKVPSAWRPASRRRKRRWNWCNADCAKEHRHWYSRFQWQDRPTEATATNPVDGVRCRCEFVMKSTAQVCPMCGRQYREPELPFPAALQLVVADWVRDTFRHYGKPVKALLRVDRPEWAGELCRQFQAAGFRFERVSSVDADNERRWAGFVDPGGNILGLIIGGDL